MLPVYVLSLAGCEARRAPLLRSLRDLGFEPEVVLGIDGRNGLAPEHESRIDRAMAKRRTGRWLTDGEFACALSHQTLCARLLAEGHEQAMILEDDAIVDRDLLPVLADLAEIDFDLLLLDHDRTRVLRRSMRRLSSGSVLWRVVNIPDMNTGYILNATGAAAIIERSFPISYMADWPCDISALRTYAIMPRAVGRPASKEASLLQAERLRSKQSVRREYKALPYSNRDLTSRINRLTSRRLL